MSPVAPEPARSTPRIRAQRPLAGAVAISLALFTLAALAGTVPAREVVQSTPRADSRASHVALDTAQRQSLWHAFAARDPIGALAAQDPAASALLAPASPLGPLAFIQRGPKLTPGKEAQGQNLFGFSVALNADGTTAIIGASNSNVGEIVAAGEVYVFTRSGETWSQQGKPLTVEAPGPSERTYFGASLALSADGNTALIGATGGGVQKKPAFIFTRSGSEWKQAAALEGKGQTSSSNFGSGVALSSNGETAIVGGSGYSGFAGAAWVFTHAEGKWSEQQKLTGTEGVGGPGLGEAVALSSSGDTALIGGPGDQNGIGAAWVFTRSEGTWSQQGAKLLPFERTGPEQRFGLRVALSSDGNTALIGGPFDNGLGSASGNVGAAWVFTRSGETWSAQQKLTASDETGGGAFGTAVAVSEDGNTALIGGNEDDKGPTRGIGAAWVFTRSGTTWSQQGPKLTAKEEIGEAGFGGSVALDAKADQAMIGGAADNSVLGAVWPFTPPPPPPVVSLAGPSDGTLTAGARPTFSWSDSDEGGPGLAKIEFLLDGTQFGADLAPGETSFTPVSPLPDGTHTWQVRVEEKLGFATVSSARAITIDATPPTVPELLQPASTEVVYESRPSFSWSLSSDQTSGVAAYSLLIDGVQAASVPAGACAPSGCALLAPNELSNGSHSWQVLALDRAGNAAAALTQTFTVLVGPPPPPGHVGLSIDEGDYATNTPSVQLDIVWPRGSNEMLVSNDGGFNSPTETKLLPVSAKLPWTLRTGAEPAVEILPKTVYVRFPDSLTPTTNFTDDIVLDENRPVIVSATLLRAARGRRASVSSNHGRAYRVRIKAREKVSGISAVEVSETRSGGTIVRLRSRRERGVLDLASVIRVTRLHAPRWVRVQTAAGTWSSWRRI